MVRSASVTLFVVLTACASNRASQTRSDTIVLTEKAHGLFVGHTDDGEVVVSATHYNAMNGLAILDTDLGIPASQSGGMMLCSRQVYTGSHLPRWICRYQADLDAERATTQDDLARPMGAVHLQQGGPAATLGVGGGGGPHSKTAAQ
jgi:hypothetical protein